MSEFEKSCELPWMRIQYEVFLCEFKNSFLHSFIRNFLLRFLRFKKLLFIHSEYKSGGEEDYEENKFISGINLLGEKLSCKKPCNQGRNMTL